MDGDVGRRGDILTFTTISAIINTQRRVLGSSSLKDGLAEFRETFGIQLGKGITMTQSIADFRISMERQIRSQISTLVKLRDAGKLKMQVNDAVFAITKNPVSYSQYSSTTASHEPVANAGDESIIVYATHCEVRFGLYNDYKEACYPIDIDEVFATWIDEPPFVQRNMISGIRSKLDAIIKRSEGFSN